MLVKQIATGLKEVDIDFPLDRFSQDAAMTPSIEYRDRCLDACPQGLHKYSLVERNSDSFDHLSKAGKITLERTASFVCVCMKLLSMYAC